MSVTVKIHREECPSNPRTEWDNVGVMACWHSRYDLGDEQPKCTPDEWLADNAPEGSIVLPLYLYDHSGITMSTGGGYPYDCQWDGGQVGVIVCTPDKIKAEWKGDRAKAENYLRGEVATYDQYLTGDVWGFTIDEPDPCECCGLEKGPEHIDSCWGFYGESLEAMQDHVDTEYHAALAEAWANR
jgi:hypothetical protein